MRYLFPFCCWLFFAILNVCYAKHVVILGPQSNEDTSHQYFKSLATLAIEKSKEDFPYQRVVTLGGQQTTQGRSIILLKRDFVNLYWSGTNIEREQTLIPIRIPLFKGLLGYRMFIVREDNIDQFSDISPEELKEKVACQGEHWPDSDILEANGYAVLRVTRFDLMFKMLILKRCDYFPRAIFEGYGEFEQAKLTYPNLAVFDDTLLHYPFPIYFFTNEQHPVLAKQIHYGLMKAHEDGSLEALMRNHTSTLNIFPLDKWRNKNYIHLSNDFLPDISDVEHSTLWLKLYPQH